MTNEELVASIQQGHTDFITQLWENNKKLFIFFCNRWWQAHSERFTQCGITQEDLIQECYFILIDAVAAYDVDSGFKYSTYIRYPMQNRFNAMLGYRNRRHEPLNVCTSLNAPAFDDTDEIELLDMVSDPASEQPFEQIEHDDHVAKLHADLDAAMQRKLNEQQKSIIRDYYYSRLSFAEIGEKQGVSPDRVKTIIQTSRKRLNCDSELRQLYRSEILQNTLYRGTGLSAFKDRGKSAVENSVEILDRLDATLRKLYGDELVDKAEKRQKEIAQSENPSTARVKGQRD